MSSSLPLPPGSLDLIPIPTLALDADGQVTLANDAAVELCARGALEGTAFQAMLHPDDAGAADLEHDAENALRLVTASGELRYVRLFSRPAEGGGALVCLAPAPSDAAVAEMSGGLIDAALLARAVHAADNSIVVADLQRPDQPLVFANHGFLELSGYASEDVIGKNCRFLQVPGGGTMDDDALLAALDAQDDGQGRSAADTLRRAIEAGESVDGLVIKNYTADGATFWNELYLTPVDHGDGVTHYVGVQNDVTERVEAQERLRRQATDLRGIVDSMPMPIGLLECYAGGRIRHTLANAAAAETFSLAPETVVGLDGLGFRGDARAIWIDAVHRAEATGGPVRFQVPRGDAETYEVTVSPVRDAPGRPDVPTHYVYIAQNVTDGVRMEHAVLQISARELSRVARDIHDGVGQTLVGASMLSSALAAELAGSPAGGEAARLQQLVRSSLGQLRKFALGLDPVDIDDVGVEAALARLAADAEALFGIEVTVTAEPCPGDLAHDAALDVYRVAQEALTNAVRHGHAEHVEIGLACDDESLTLTVHDDGDGIPDGQHKDLDGMGLRTMRARARRLGGRLDIRPHPRGGTVVHVHARRTTPIG